MYELSVPLLRSARCQQRIINKASRIGDRRRTTTLSPLASNQKVVARSRSLFHPPVAIDPLREFFALNYFEEIY